MQAQDNNDQHSNRQQPATSSSSSSSTIASSQPPSVNASLSRVTVRLCGASQSECGYCHGQRAAVVQQPPEESSAVAMGLWMETGQQQPPLDPPLSVAFASSWAVLRHQLQQQRLLQLLQQQTTLYEQFVYRGWRRSGRYLYKPDNWSSCCPAITIRLNVQQFAPTKSQRRVVQKMKRLLEPSTKRLTTPGPSSKLPPLASDTATIQASGVMTMLQDWTNDILQTYWREHVSSSSNDQSSSSSLPAWWNDILPVTFKFQPNQTNAKKQLSKQPLKQTQQPSKLATINGNHATGHHPQPKKRPIDALAGSNPTTIIKEDDIHNHKQPPKRNEQKQHQQPQQAQIYTLFTTICAAMAGRSQGKLRREDVSNHVAQILEQQWDQYAKNTTTTNQTHASTIQIHKIESHAKSGHVLVRVVVVDNTSNEHSKDNNPNPIIVDDQEMHDGDAVDTRPTYHQIDNNDDENNDVFTTWWKTEASLRRGHWAWSQRQPSPLRPPPHQLQVSTLSAWDSALDPDVFRLYTLYQHQVHDESDALAYEYGSSDSSDAMEDANHDGDDALEPDQDEDDPDNEGGGGDEQWNQQSQAMLESAFLRHCVSHPRRQGRIRKAFDSFVHFLVDTPFSNRSPERDEERSSHPRGANDESSREDHYNYPPGTYHQHYRIDGALVAVGVVDLLPQGLSSVYLFYHPSFSHKHVALGKYCSWKEIEFAQQCQVPFYYLGYYIESCPKMRYKAEYQPSELLCPSTYEWVDAKVAQDILRTRSPVHHCCPLYYPPVPTLASEPTSSESASGSRETTDITVTHQQLQQQQQQVDANLILQSILLEVGLPHPVTLPMLQHAAQDIVRPLLEALYNETSSQIVRQCIVKLV